MINNTERAISNIRSLINEAQTKIRTENLSRHEQNSYLDLLCTDVDLKAEHFFNTSDAIAHQMEKLLNSLCSAEQKKSR